MNLFEKVALYEELAVNLNDDSALPEASEGNDLINEFATTAKARRNSMKKRAVLLKKLGQ